MIKSLLICLFTLVLFNCKNNEKLVPNFPENKTCSKPKQFEMYKTSEMAALMEQMFAENNRLKQRITKGDTIGKFPSYFLNIHKAQFTDPTDNDDFFKKNALLFIKAQQLIYSNPSTAKDNFNAAVNACITCHEGTCGGPIPKIKKLIIL